MSDLSLTPTRALANAGCGKTQLLGVKYLSLLLAGANPARILASTFTRKAAGEMRDRVLHLAACAVREGESSSAFTGQGLSFGPEAARRALWSVVENEDRLLISTLDAWFARVAAAYPTLTGIPLGARLLEEGESRRYLQQAVDRSCSGPEGESLAALLDALSKGGRTVRLASLVERQVAGMLSTWQDCAARDADRSAASHGEPPSAWRWSAALAGVPEWGEAREELRGCAAALCTLAEGAPTRLSKALQSGFGDADRQLRDSGDLEYAKQTLKRTLVQSVLTGNSTYYKVPLPADIAAKLRAVGLAAQAIVMRHCAQVTEMAGRNLGTIAAHMRAAMVERGVMDFDLVTRGVGDAFSRGEALELLERMDGSIDHILLDEFQDTSVAQWRALRPLLSEACAGEGASGQKHVLVVGDIKQAIFGWRDGDSGILEHLGQAIAEPGSGAAVALHDVTLNTNYRSSPAVLRAVDRIMKSVTTATDGPGADEWAKQYEPHIAGRVTRTGAVRCHVVEQAQELDRLVEIVGDIRDAQPDWSIGVIVRKNVHAHRAALRLREAGIPAVALSGGMVQSSAAVGAVLDLLRFATNPRHTAALANAAMSPLARVPGLEWLQEAVNESRTAMGPGGGAGEQRWRGERAREVRQRIATDGLAATLGGWVRVLDEAGELSAGDRARARVLIEGAAAREVDGPVDLSRFERDLSSRRADEGAGAGVEVLNIHKAKGLEWDAVICFGISESGGGVQNWSVERAVDGSGPLRVLRRPVNGSVDDASPMGRVVHAAEVTRNRESLACLYVMLTRARHLCDIMLHVHEKNEPKGWGGTIARGLGINVDATAAATSVVEAEGDWRERDGGASARVPPPSTTWIEGLPPESTLGVVRRASHASALAGAGRSATAHGEAAVESSRLAMARGTILHRVAESCECSTVWDRSPRVRAVLAAELAQSLGADGDGLDIAGEIDRAVRALENPAVAVALQSPAARGERGSVWTELRCAELVDDGDGALALRESSIDRLVAWGTPGAWTHAEVIDFKSDWIDPANAESAVQDRVEHHRPQLEVYCEVAAKVLGLPGGSAAVTARIVFTHPGRVESLPRRA